ncbi:MAG: hypothetical protein ACKVTZ_04190 [Bacteroidia bacterium]
METIVLHIPTDKKDFFLSLLKELSFVKVEEPQKAYIAAILESEKDIAEGKTISQEDLKVEIHSWRKS